MRTHVNLTELQVIEQVVSELTHSDKPKRIVIEQSNDLNWIITVEHN